MRRMRMRMGRLVIGSVAECVMYVLCGVEGID